MTINQIIELLRKDGCNSKQRVIDMLENATSEELHELKRDIECKLNKKAMED